MICWKLSVLSMASPKPGVSTTVNRSLTPRSSISTVEASNWTVFFFSNFSAALGTIRSVETKTSKGCINVTKANDTLKSGVSNSKMILHFIMKKCNNEKFTEIRQNDMRLNQIVSSLFEMMMLIILGAVKIFFKAQLY
jgi:hypothetical protein